MTDSSLAATLQDRYVLERELGHGGMATVYLARDLKHKRPVALKVLRPDLAATLAPDRFRREIETAARLQHPHICSVYDSGEAAGRLCLLQVPYQLSPAWLRIDPNFAPLRGDPRFERLLITGPAPARSQSSGDTQPGWPESASESVDTHGATAH